MKSKNLTILPMPKVDVSVTHIKIDRNSPLNQTEPHIHKKCEIYLNLSGDVSFEVENHIYPISRGSVIVTRPLEYHYCIYHSEAEHEHFCITFSAENQDDFLKLFFDREQGSDNLIILDETQLKNCLFILDELMKSENDSLTLRIEFCKLLKILSQGNIANSTTYVDKIPEDVSKALRFMDEHLTYDIEIEALSNFCNVSVNTLERHFKKALGLTPLATLRKKRLISSMEFLRNGDSITDAAIKSGFSDYSNYIQIFRKQFGFTPLQYKKKFEIK